MSQPQVKTCSRCKETKPLSEFGLEKATKDGHKNYCYPCANAHQREYRQREPERFRQYEALRLERHGDERRQRDRERWAAERSERESSGRYRFARKIWMRFGITLAEYDEIVSRPCFLCGATEKVVLDHDHETGVMRGPLCRGCNVGLGIFGDDPARLRAAANYIEQHRKGGDAV